VTKQKPDDDPSVTQGRTPVHVRMPGFVTDEDIGLGDSIKRVTYALGIKPCGGCEKRAAQLNRWMVFTRLLAAHS
jgi:hypothetical protein